LINLLGISEEVDKGIILKCLRASDIRGSIEKIANYLGLPIAVNLVIGSEYETTALSGTDHAGHGVMGITAQVFIPSHLPFYGSPGMKGFPVTVKVSPECTRHPETFIAVMAHELSHVVLQSLWHKEKENEFYIDLTAMLLGFSTVMKDGRKVEEVRNYVVYTKTLTTTYGYLSDEQFKFAFRKIAEIRKRNITSKKTLLKKLVTYGRLVSSYKREFLRFQKFIEYLDKHRDKAISKKDIPRIMQLHQLDYADRLRDVIQESEKNFEKINDFCIGLIHCNQENLNLLRQFNEQITTSIGDLEKAFRLLKNDVRILSKYVSFPYKLRLPVPSEVHEQPKK
jgi:hypothetical protein